MRCCFSQPCTPRDSLLQFIVPLQNSRPTLAIAGFPLQNSFIERSNSPADLPIRDCWKAFEPSMLGGGTLQGRSCVCSTSYQSAAPRLRSQWQPNLKASPSSCQHANDFWGRSPTAAFKNRQTRRSAARCALKIEARRTRPDPIIAPYIVKDQGGQEASCPSIQHT